MMPTRVLAIAAILVVTGCNDSTSVPSSDGTSGNDSTAAGSTNTAQESTPSAGETAGEPERRRALFGELHLHTSLSYDAYGFSGARTDPDTAYRFARGEAVEYLGEEVRRGRPLDFMAVTDHARFMGFLNQLEDPDSPLSRSEFGQRYRRDKEHSTDPGTLTRNLFAALSDPSRVEDLGVRDALTDAWDTTIEAANRHYRPGEFTTFIGYEWTSHPDDRYNLHRNVIFKGDRAPLPFTALDSERPEDLWSYLEASRERGMEALAIPHNANASGGEMFSGLDSDGNPVDAEYARRRALNEPLNEIYQGKGQSETVPALSPNDEFADFEIFDRLVPRVDLPSEPEGSYVRDALGRGLAIAERTGVNPYKYGTVAATDFHNALSTGAEDAFNRAFGVDPQVNPPGRDETYHVLHVGDDMLDTLLLGSGGLTGVWAEENDRDSIYEAFRRREAFGTSGTRLKVRLFAGWDYPTGSIHAEDWLGTAYGRGVPMGADLPPRPEAGAAPTFLVWALKDPEGANLDRAQIIKVWTDDAGQHERIFDVALSDGRSVDPETGKAPLVGNTVDTENASYRNSIGAVQLRAQWTDPEFDPQQSAVYYLRVLEIPTPRWTTIMAARHDLALPEGSPATLQERAWSSPIWYSPSADMGEVMGAEAAAR